LMQGGGWTTQVPSSSDALDPPLEPLPPGSVGVVSSSSMQMNEPTSTGLTVAPTSAVEANKTGQVPLESPSISSSANPEQAPPEVSGAGQPFKEQPFVRPPLPSGVLMSPPILITIMSAPRSHFAQYQGWATCIHVYRYVDRW